jgi:phosphatidylserine/phosphatidylglycerophosphate/cardiolipin synthase-like enzyme/uncharacterized membrane protein YdjX (TVP38/TMEM64 family)
MGRVLYLQKEHRARRDAAASESLLRPGYNCSAVARAERVALLIDAEAYFKAFHAAALKAQRSIMVLAWDFNSRTRLHFEPAAKDGPPALLGDFLNFLVRRRRGLHINILNWDYPMVFGADREFPPLYGFGWTPARRVHLRYDDTHPIAGCQHQKIAVFDDALAFCGGIDLTVRRFDCPEHRADDPRRVAYDKPYPPFHDLMMAVDGEAARALADIARERWNAATGKTLPAAGTGARNDPWPEHLEAQMRDVDVGIARTMPPRGEVPAIREIEKLYLDTIAAARQTLYIENQYFTSPRIATAIEKRLQEREGPEVVLVLRLLSHGWLEEHTMQVLRTRLVQRLLAADRYGRFHVYYPHVPGLPEGSCLDVHSKLMICDDTMLRVGSANICNRSMALDSECDLAIESRGRPEVAETILGLRDQLLAEHLCSRPEAVRAAVERAGTLHGAIEEIGGDGRCLRPFEDLKEWPEAIVELAAVADPEEPIAPAILDLERKSEGEEPGPAQPGWLKLAFIAAVFFGLAALWRFTPLADLISAESVIAWAHDFGRRWWAPLLIIAAYTPACFVMFPRPLITLAAVVAFGAWLGFLYALIGIVASAAVTYYVGRRMRRDTVRRLAGPKLDRIVAVLKKHGLLAMTLLRLVPLAPFAVEGMVAGAVRLKLWHLLAGTAIGMLPGTLAATLFGDQIERAASGGGFNWWIVGGAALLLTAGAIAVKRWFSRMSARMSDQLPAK